MIYSKLKEILKERGITISHLSENTGISRTTLTSLVHNTGNGIQFETLEKLCWYLNISPNDLLEVFPFKVGTTIYPTFEITKEQVLVGGYANLQFINLNTDKIDFSVDVQLDGYIELQYENAFVLNLFLDNDSSYKYQQYIADLSISDKSISIFKDIINSKLITNIITVFNFKYKNLIKLDNKKIPYSIDNSVFNRWTILEIYKRLKD